MTFSEADLDGDGVVSISEAEYLVYERDILNRLPERLRDTFLPDDKCVEKNRRKE